MKSYKISVLRVPGGAEVNQANFQLAFKRLVCVAQHRLCERCECEKCLFLATFVAKKDFGANIAPVPDDPDKYLLELSGRAPEFLPCFLHSIDGILARLKDVKTVDKDPQEEERLKSILCDFEEAEKNRRTGWWPELESTISRILGFRVITGIRTSCYPGDRSGASAKILGVYAHGSAPFNKRIAEFHIGGYSGRDIPRGDRGRDWMEEQREVWRRVVGWAMAYADPQPTNCPKCGAAGEKFFISIGSWGNCPKCGAEIPLKKWDIPEMPEGEVAC